MGLFWGGGVVPYVTNAEGFASMTLEQLEAVLRDNERSIQYADFEIADELFRREVIAKLDLRLWPPVPKKPGDKTKEVAKDLRRVVLEEIPPMPLEEPPF